MSKQYKTLIAGDIRHPDDNQREKEYVTGAEKLPFRYPAGPWTRVWLAGRTILASDLMHLEFRREEK